MTPESYILPWGSILLLLFLESATRVIYIKYARHAKNEVTYTSYIRIQEADSDFTYQ